MSGSPKLTFYGISLRIFNRLRKKASRKGIPVLNPTGEAEKDGVVIQWKYDAKSEMLEVECTHIPFWIDSARVNRDLQNEIEASLNQRRPAA
jgi:hypothetical protein